MAFDARTGTFALAFSAFFPRGDAASDVTTSHVVVVTTRAGSTAFQQFSPPVLVLNGSDYGFMGLCSPNFYPFRGGWVMTLNGWGDNDGGPTDRLLYVNTTNFTAWSKVTPLAKELDVGQREIDAAVTWDSSDGGSWILAWKGGADRSTTQLASARSLDGPWTLLGAPTMTLASGQPAFAIHENFDFFEGPSGATMLVTSDYGNFLPGPRQTWVYERDETADAGWLTWSGGRALNISQQSFNTHDRANAGFVAPWTQYDGYWYCVYAGNTDGSGWGGRGHNQLGLARSSDLIAWEAAADAAAPL